MHTNIGAAMKQSVLLDLLDETGRRIHGSYLELYDQGRYHGSIEVELVYDFADLYSKEETRNAFYMGQGLARWECGVLEDCDIERIAAAPASDSQAELLEVLSSAVKKVRSRKNRRRNLAPYGPGVGLSVSTENKYCAFFVSAVNTATGDCLVEQFDYFEDVPPCIEDFQARRRLVLTHGNWKNDSTVCWYSIMKTCQPDARYIQPICKVDLVPDDATDCWAFTGWSAQPICQAPLQRRWEGR